MGASRWRLVRQLMVENLLLALAGGGVALAITFWTARTLGDFLPTTSLPLNINGSVDGTVMLVTIPHCRLHVGCGRRGSGAARLRSLSGDGAQG